ncbi:hypothetical protein F2Q70_00036060 [Brassica cretica]|uniref:Uncharacterized protein n=1 Tax=Brassica cretica TaxID=69181 RepID=A0A8S9JXU7_BRACR|nr:hypothetical protein F2Q70_00036060 [Brassica cretica]
MAALRLTYIHATEEELQQLRHEGFAVWLLNYVTEGLARGEVFDDWILEFVRGPNYVVKSYPKYTTRGYAFSREGHSKKTYDAGVSSSSGDDVYICIKHSKSKIFQGWQRKVAAGGRSLDAHSSSSYS